MIWRGMVILALVALGGCANWNAVYRTKTIGPNGPRVITVDAKQRNVVMVPEPKESAGNPVNLANASGWRICAEASPDVFSALSASASAALEADVKSQSGAGRVALAIAETAATIERTQTVNLLRESFYRTCERYMSGAISKSAFVVQAGRDWKAMIAILAIEQLTRSARPPATILVAGGTSASVTSPSDLARVIEQSQAKRDRAEVEHAAVVAANKTDVCDTGTAEEIAACKARNAVAEKAIADALAVRDRARRNHEEILASVGKSPPGSNVSSTAGGTAQAGGGDDKRSGSDLQAVAGVVDKIATIALESDEMRLFCIQKLDQEPSSRQEEGLRNKCLGLLSAAAEFDEQRYFGEMKRLNQERIARFSAIDQALPDNEWQIKWKAAVRSVRLFPEVETRLLAASTREDAINLFRGLDRADDQSEILVALNNGASQ